MKHVPRHVPAKTNEGWSVVALVALLAAACIVAVTVIHRRTWKQPTDPTYTRSLNQRTPAGAPRH
ncbi:MAG TPA: hypothetical protein VFT29_08020 [Gemmatimonadaceae bacterium]|nr:hypothetical protein [Gemmatimonadaceae bacterium]